MARTSRTMSPTGHYHIIARGNGKQRLFEDSGDYNLYLDFLDRYSGECKVAIHAYCLMSNHVHLLIHDTENTVATFMKKLDVSYAGYYNNKYEHVGHLFQGRYLSEPITSENHLLIVFRYILNNPEKAGICPNFAYPWSSYSQYTADNSIVDTGLIRNLLGGVSEYESFLRADNDDACLEYDQALHNDGWAKELIQQRLGTDTAVLIQAMSKTERNEMIREFKSMGMSVRQIERFTGIGRNIIQRA